MALPEENEAPAQAKVCALINPHLRLPPKLNLLTGNIAEKLWNTEATSRNLRYCLRFDETTRANSDGNYYQLWSWETS